MFPTLEDQLPPERTLNNHMTNKKPPWFTKQSLSTGLTPMGEKLPVSAFIQSNINSQLNNNRTFSSINECNQQSIPIIIENTITNANIITTHITTQTSTLKCLMQVVIALLIIIYACSITI